MAKPVRRWDSDREGEMMDAAIEKCVCCADYCQQSHDGWSAERHAHSMLAETLACNR